MVGIERNSATLQGHANAALPESSLLLVPSPYAYAQHRNHPKMPLETALHAAGAYLDDQQSQMLALTDALHSANAPALVRVFTAVALARGIEWIALAAGLERSALFRALENPSRPDLALLTFVVARLVERAEQQDLAGPVVDNDQGSTMSYGP
jgi:DNA-binding phage protein